MYGWYSGGWWWWLMMASMILFWVAIVGGVIWFIVYLVRRPTGTGTGSAETALDILNKRYARGEITSEEYERLKRDISGT